ncbi:hypothetical protein Ahy_A03g011851 [Arachis hypogaea]|uniref:Uncharacterized protein n=1 Tax=Arachis hypogaea TaxID=3818 RepID=A0A445DRW3_ARAHY|nr:hypothetical protein Ahy_A03g011851 [Arachis hypogaea]
MKQELDYIEPKEWERKVMFKVVLRVERMTMEKPWLLCFKHSASSVDVSWKRRQRFSSSSLLISMLLFCLPGWKMIQIAVDRSVSPVIPPRMHHPSRSSLGTNRYADHNINSLNWSLFQTFKEPRTLDLSNNCIHGFIWNGDYRTNSRLNKLEKLDLSNNFFINLSIMEPLSILTSLRNLNLAGNNISGTFPTFLNLKSSVFGSLLVMKSNIDQILFLQDFMSLTALETLDLSHNSVNISIMESLSALTSLKNLFLAENKLVGPLPTKGSNGFDKGVLKTPSLVFQLSNLCTYLIIKISKVSTNLSQLKQLVQWSYPCINRRDVKLANLDLTSDNFSGEVPMRILLRCTSNKGNPNLSWIKSNRGNTTPPPLIPPVPLNGIEENDSAMDFTSFCWTFSVSYVMVIIILVMILWINPHWRRAWFYFVEHCRLRCFGQFLQLNF